jgi:predicted phosphohydrolase
MKIAITADLHWSVSDIGDRCTRWLAKRLRQINPDLLILVGDTGVGNEMAHCLDLFKALDCVKLLVAGNHCLWSSGSAIDSMQIYTQIIPATAKRFGFHYLDAEPWFAADGSLAVVGNINWYDYSYASPVIAHKYPHCEEMYWRKEFINGWHNDGRFVRLGMSDVEFTQRVLEKLKRDIEEMSQQADLLVAAIHHPPFPELFYPLKPHPSDDELIWLAYTGNRAISKLLLQYPKLRYVFCGHTHFAREAQIGHIHAFNIGGDYDWKRLAVLELPPGKVEFEEFRDR